MYSYQLMKYLVNYQKDNCLEISTDNIEKVDNVFSLHSTPKCFAKRPVVIPIHIDD